MKMKLEKTVTSTEPNTPMPVSQPSSFLLVIASPLSGSSGVLGSFAIGPLLLGCIHGFFQIRPKHLVFGVFEVLKMIPFHGKNKNQGGANAHRQTCQNRDPGKIHRDHALGPCRITGRFQPRRTTSSSLPR